MRGQFGGVTTSLSACFVLVTAWAAAGQAPAAGQPPIRGQFGPYNPPRTAEGRPDLNGIWQALGTADWDIEAHQARAGPYTELLGAYIAEPGGQGIVEGGSIPYQPDRKSVV